MTGIRDVQLDADSPPRVKLEELGTFLRSRRELLLPGQAGFKVSQQRKTPGLRREEVAELAGISESWYTRVELGTAGVPSSATIYAIAQALRLSPLDARYVFELAGRPVAAATRSGDAALSPTVDHVIMNLNAAAVTLYDWYCTPHCWNAIADGMFRLSMRQDAFHRNMIVLGLTDPYYRNMCGTDSEYEKVARGVIGTFRRAFTTSEPTELAQKIFKFAMSDPFFRSIWNQSRVAEAFTEAGPVIRHLPELGVLRFDYSDLIPAGQTEMLIRVLSPSDAETRTKVSRLAAMGTASISSPASRD